MASIQPSVKLNTGANMPIIGLGTWQSKDEEVQNAVEYAIDIGYRHIDTAYAYKNESAIGKAIHKKFKAGIIKREDIFIVTKVPGIYAKREDVKHSIEKSLAALQLDYVDLLLIHTPILLKRIDDDTIFPVDKDGKILYMEYDNLQTWKTMEEVFDLGLTKAIGLSNFNSKQIQYICDNARVQPANLQVECHAYFPQHKLFEFCKKKNITFAAFGPIGSPTRWFQKPDDPVLMEDPALKPLMEKHNKSAAQILLRWLIQRGVIVLPKSVNSSRIKENFEIFDFNLTDGDMEVVNGINRDLRLFLFDRFSDAPNFPFAEPF